MKKRLASFLISILIFTALGVCTFTVFASESAAASQAANSSVSYNLNYNSRMAVGTKQQIQVIIYGDDSASNPSFSSENTSVATVSSSGVVTAKATGTAVIKYSPDGVSTKKISISVLAMPNSVSLSASVKSLNEGQSFSLNARVNSNAYPTTIRYTTTNSNIASVSSSGTVTARGEGKAVVTAITENGVRASCTVYVYSNSGISLNKTSAKVAMDYSNVTKVVYGKSVRGRDLEAYVINGTGNNSKTLFCTFAVHGFEDNYDHDGKVLVNCANNLITYFANNPSELRDYRIVIVPCANPDGTIDGKNNLRTGSSAFGRCTAAHVDMNRDFISGSFKGQESRALRDLMKSYKMNVYIDFHGWLNTVLGNGTLVDIFRSTNGISRDQTGSYGTSQGYIIGWANANLGARSALVEFKSPSNCNYTKVANGIKQVVSGSYNPQSTTVYKYTNSISAVQNVRSTSATTNSVSLAWNSVSGAKGYRVEYTKDGSNWSNINVLGKTSATVSGLDCGKKYYFRVRAFTDSGNVRTYSNNVSALVVKATRPEAVTNFKASGRTSDGSAIILNWTQKLNADGYNIYQQINGKWVQIANIEGGMSANYRVPTSADTKYTFAIEAYTDYAVNAGERTTYTTYSSCPAPDDFNVNAVSSNIIRAEWKAKSDIGYYVQYATDIDFTKNVGGVFVDAGKNYCEIQTSQYSKNYYVKVRSCRNYGSEQIVGGFSQILSTKDSLFRPYNLNVYARGNGGKSVYLSWSGVDGADGYKVYIISNGKRVLQGTTADTKYTFTNLTPAWEYDVVVDAYNSTKTSSSTTYRICAAPAPVSGLTAVLGADNSSAVISWDESACHGYYIEWSTDSSFKSNVSGVFSEGSANTNYTVKIPADAESFYVRVRSYKYYNGSRVFGDFSSPYSLDDLLAAPKNFNVYARGDGGTDLYLDWDDVKNAVGYIIYIVSGSNSYFKGDTSESKYTFTDLTPAWEYDVKVVAYNDNGKEASSIYHICAAPAPVSGLTATLSSDNSSAVVSWNEGACHGYYIEWSTDSSFKSIVSGTFLAGSTSTNYTVKIPAGAENFYVRVRSYKYYNGTKLFSDFSSPYSLEGLLAAPKDFNVYARGDGGTDLYLDWSDVKNADGYKIYIVSDSNSYFKGDTSESKYTFTDLTPSWEYDVKVIAYNDKGKEASSIYHICAAPCPVENFKVSIASNDTVKISWNKMAAHGYYVQWATNESFTENVGGMFTSDTTNTLDFPDNFRDYYVRVRSWKWYNDERLFGDFTSPEYIGDQLASPDGYNVYARGAGGKNLYLEWNEVDGADGYKVYIVSGSTKYFKGDVTEPKYTFTDLTPAWEYDVMVVAYNDATSNSSEYHICAAPCPVSEFDVKAVDDSTALATWSVEASHGYYIQWSTDENFTENVEGEFIMGSGSTTKEISVDGDISDYYFKVRVWKYYEDSRLYSDFCAPMQVSE